jgi:hypothetical protein
LVWVSGEILINFEICCTLNTIGFDKKKLKVVLGELEIHYIKYKYRIKEIELLQGMENAIVLEIEKIYQQKILKWKEDGFPKGK